MTLARYNQKRNFKKTSEPRGAKKSSKTKNLYLIQKHAASHLHYDFRLELNGRLLSWAVPKGPSLDPAVKRLAMHVEDHPLDYGSFEGIIPQGEYGGGTVMLWDTGSWECLEDNPEAAYRQGHLKFIVKGKKLKGLWKLIQIKKDPKSWLLMKGDDKYSKSADEYDITISKNKSAKSNKTIEQIAKQADSVWHSNRADKAEETLKKYASKTKNKTGVKSATKKIAKPATQKRIKSATKKILSKKIPKAKPPAKKKR